MEKIVEELIEDLEHRKRLKLKRLVEYQLATEKLKKEIDYIDTKIEKIKRRV